MKAFISICLLTLFTTQSIAQQLNECWPLKLNTVCKKVSLQCSHSQQCESNKICCRHECGTTCLATEQMGKKPDHKTLVKCSSFKPEFNCFQYDKKCDTNFDCQTNQFCCQSECGTQCRDKISEEVSKDSEHFIDESHLNSDIAYDQPGCPAPIMGIPCTMSVKLCQQDSDCKGKGKICCMNPCGSSCH